MVVGFTGTRKGMSQKQKKVVQELLVELGATELHHGDCVGADSDAHDIARSLGLVLCGHPPTVVQLRAFKDCDMLSRAKPYLERDRIIVDETELLIATPAEYTRPDKPRGGTWYTLTYGEKRNKPVIIVYRDGRIEGRDL